MISVNYPRTMPGCKPLYLAGINESEKICLFQVRLNGDVRMRYT
jgi:hypothetical protein